jgi:hypothetical protein
LLGRHGEEQRVLPKFVIVQPARALKAPINPRGQIVRILHCASFSLSWHGLKMPPGGFADKQTVSSLAFFPTWVPFIRLTHRAGILRNPVFKRSNSDTAVLPARGRHSERPTPANTCGQF